MATYQVNVIHKSNRKPATRDVIVEANSPAKAQKDALAALAQKYPQHEVLEVQVQRLNEPMILQGIKFMQCNYQPPAKRMAQAIALIESQRTSTGYLTSMAGVQPKPQTASV